jgi:hypothetical protein
VSIEPIGLLTLIVGLICLHIGFRATAATLVVAPLFGAAAAVLIGTANIQPAHLLLAFGAVATFTRRRETAQAIGATRFPEPGFWLMCLVIYGTVTAILMPRLLAGTMACIPLGTSEYAETGSTVPLSPTSGNLTQSIYLVGDFACFIMIVGIASTQAGFATIAGALVAYAAGNVLFALIDIATYNTGTQWLLDFIRNAQYTLHIEEEISGLKRIGLRSLNPGRTRIHGNFVAMRALADCDGTARAGLTRPRHSVHVLNWPGWYTARAPHLVRYGSQAH